MKKSVLFTAAVLSVMALLFVPGVVAQTANATAVTFVGMQRHQTETPCCYDGTDQPLQSDAYQYDVSLKRDCTIYTGRYQNAMDYFPAFRPGEVVHAEILKHSMVLASPSGKQLRMPIIARSTPTTCARN